MYERNVAISCRVCGYSNVRGRESHRNFNGNIITECKWICPRCNCIVRQDTKKQ